MLPLSHCKWIVLMRVTFDLTSSVKSDGIAAERQNLHEGLAIMFGTIK